jgi:hypothetical protein
MSLSSSEPRFEPEPFRTCPKSSSKFRLEREPHKMLQTSLKVCRNSSRNHWIPDLGCCYVDYKVRRRRYTCAHFQNRCRVRNVATGIEIVPYAWLITVNGVYCIPTSAQNLITHLSQTGFLGCCHFFPRQEL